MPTKSTCNVIVDECSGVLTDKRFSVFCKEMTENVRSFSGITPCRCDDHISVAEMNVKQEPSIEDVKLGPPLSIQSNVALDKSSQANLDEDEAVMKTRASTTEQNSGEGSGKSGDMDKNSGESTSHRFEELKLSE